MPTLIATYFTYADFNRGVPSTEKEFQAYLSKYARSKVVYLCAVLNAFLSSWEGPKVALEDHDELVRYAFAPSYADLMIRKSRDPTETRFVFHRQQLLFVAREALVHCSEDGADPLVAPHWGELGIVFLMANDRFNFDGPEMASSQDEMLNILAEFVLMKEYSGRSRYLNRVARAYLMLTQFAEALRGHPCFLDIPAEFSKAAGLTLIEYEALCFGILSRYIRFDLTAFKANPRSFLLPRTCFNNSAISQERVERFLGDISETADGLRQRLLKGPQGRCDFTCFRSKPFFADGENLYPLDAEFLSEKMETGPFWHVLGSLGSDESKKGLHSFWGAVFQEYVNWLLSSSIDSAMNMYYPSPKYVSTGEEACDGIVVCGTSALIFEYKGSTFTARAKYSGDPTLLQQEIQGKLVMVGNEPKAVAQLARTIRRMFHRNNPVAIQGVDLSPVRKVFPVVVTRDDIGGALLINYLLNEQFQSLLNKKFVRPRVVTPLFCLTAEDLEVLSAYLREVTFSDVLEARYNADPSLKSAFELVDNPILAAIGTRTNGELDRKFHEIANLMTQQHFPGAPPLPLLAK